MRTGCVRADSSGLGIRSEADDADRAVHDEDGVAGFQLQQRGRRRIPFAMEDEPRLMKGAGQLYGDVRSAAALDRLGFGGLLGSAAGG
ncbi:hypothetical protein OROGR_000500 [Orobanche gracilis]